MNSLRRYIRKALTETYYTTWKKLQEAPVDTFRGQEVEISQKLAKHFKIEKILPLANGKNGFAYVIPNNRVLKITKDKSEVAEAKKIQGKKLKHLAEVYGTYTLGGPYTGTYVIILELLSQGENIEKGELAFEEFLDKEFSYDFTYFLDDYSNGSVSPEEIKDYKEKLAEFYTYDQDKLNLALWFMNGMMGIINEIRKNGIKSSDWVIENLGIKKNGNLGMFDFGYGDTNIPSSVPNIDLNENIGPNDFPEFLDTQSNPLMFARPFPPVMNPNTAPLRETEISQEEVDKKYLPYRHADMIDAFIQSKSEAEIREVAPDIDLNRSAQEIVSDLDAKYPSIFDNFAEWIFQNKKTAG